MKQRIITAAIALAILIPLIFIGGIYFAAGMGVVAILAYKEVLDLKSSHKPVPNIVKILGMIALIFLVLGFYQEQSNIFFINIELIILPIVLLLIPTIFYKKDDYETKDAFYLIGFILLIGMIFKMLIGIRNLPGENNGLFLLIYLISVTIFTDSFAYIIGILIGKHKMAPKISPKKSWEGFAAGLIGGTVASSIVYANLIGNLTISAVILTVILSFCGQMGDLIFSKIKRENNIKDFSNIMPGHGGMLDRIDSITLVIFVYLLLSNLI